MSLIHVTDAGGESIPVIEHNGTLFPKFPKESIIECQDLTFRPDDILICSFPKSGVHWVQEILRLLQMGRLEKDITGKEKFMIELQPNKTLDELSSPRILNTHLSFRDLPPDVRNKKCKIVHLMRNPKDAIVSMYNFVLKLPQQNNYHGKWENFLKLALEGKTWYGTWWDYARKWEEDLKSDPNATVLPLWYEDLVQDSLREIRRMNEFFGFNRDLAFLESLRDYVTFSNMKAVKTAQVQNNFQDVVFRKGHVGDWRNWFTVAQNDEFDQRLVKEMKGSKVKCKFTLPVTMDANRL